MNQPVKCPASGCGGTEFMSSTPDGSDRQAWAFYREKGKLKRVKIGEVVICCRCDRSVVLTETESFLTVKAKRAIEAPKPVFAVDADRRPPEPEPTATSLLP